MMTYTTIAVIYNPNSTGSSKVLAEKFEAQLSQKLPGQKIELIATEYAGHAKELAYSIAKDSQNPLVISSSGDGGYSEVVNGAMQAQQEGYTITTGLLPAGNANDHFHNLHDEDIVELIIAGKSKKIDLLKVVGTEDGKELQYYAHSYIGVGLTPKIAKELNKTKLNAFKETWLVAKLLFTVKSIRLKVGDKVRNYESIIFSNVDRMSKYLTVSQPSEVTDGKFEVTIFRRRNKLQLIQVLLKASVIGVKEDSQAETFSFETVDKTLLQADGEIMMLDGKTECTVTIEKQILNCVV